MTRVRRVVVVVPARDEEELLPRCLTSIADAAAQLTSTASSVEVQVEVQVVVVLDDCVDGSEAVVRAFPFTVVTTTHGRVGAARDTGAVVGLRAAASEGVRPESVWVSCTDADTEVPRHWLTTHVELAATGVDVVVGTVEPVGLSSPAVLRRWHERHDLAEGHPYVHGANLGLRGSTYLEVGGFGAVECHEDVNLVARLRAGTARWVATDTVRVRTSGRHLGRVSGGFADYLDRIRGGEASAS